MKILSIDPGLATGIMVVEYDPMAIPGEETLTILNFDVLDLNLYTENGNVDIRPELVQENRYRQINKLLEFIDNEGPDVVILENFIMYKVQMGTYGQSFKTSEMIGVIEHYCRGKEIPVIKPRASELRKPITEYYIKTDDDGVVTKVPKPRKFKDNLTNKALVERGLLRRGRYNKLYIPVGDKEYDMSDFKVGSKNDHMLMALKHVINLLESSKVRLEQKVDAIKKAWEREYE